jgi:hypothetical protein
MVAVTDTEILQLLEPELHGPSPKFLDDALGILSLDDRKYVPNCKGEHPRRIEEEIRKTGGLSGQSLIATFVGPPYGYPPDLVRACVAGLLRGRKLRIRPEAGDEITSYRDAGVRELFTKDRPFRKAEIFLPAEDPITARDRVAIRKFFETFVGVSLEQEDEAFADAAFKYFPRERDDLREIERRHEQLPGRPALPERLAKLGKGAGRLLSRTAGAEDRAGTETAPGGSAQRDGAASHSEVRAGLRGGGGRVPGGPHPRL